jgi:hypothetical protein
MRIEVARHNREAAFAADKAGPGLDHGRHEYALMH